MKKLIGILFFLLSFTGLQAQKDKNVVYDANIEPRSVNSFSAIEISSAIDLYLSQGDEEAVGVSASDDEIRSRIKTVVNNGVLKIYFDGKGWKSWGNYRMKAYVTFKQLQRLEASGACNVRVADKITVDNLLLEFSGASDFKGELAIKQLNIEGSGACSFTLEGSAENMVVDISGASSVKAFDLKAEKCKAMASGASAIRVNVAKELSASASGASSINYKGDGIIKDVSSTGGSSIRRRD